jgi:hypothetical protein
MRAGGAAVAHRGGVPQRPLTPIGRRGTSEEIGQPAGLTAITSPPQPASTVDLESRVGVKRPYFNWPPARTLSWPGTPRRERLSVTYEAFTGGPSAICAVPLLAPLSSQPGGGVHRGSRCRRRLGSGAQLPAANQVGFRVANLPPLVTNRSALCVRPARKAGRERRGWRGLVSERGARVYTTAFHCAACRNHSALSLGFRSRVSKST